MSPIMISTLIIGTIASANIIVGRWAQRHGMRRVALLNYGAGLGLVVFAISALGAFA